MDNKKYEDHFLLDINTVKDFVKDNLKIFDDNSELCASEIGDGNINYVFKVFDKKSGKSIVVKQADKLLRSSGRPLDLYRNKIEAEILKIQSKLAPDFIPKIYDYDENMFALSMEDISDYKNLRKELMECKTFNLLAEQISRFMVDTLIPTTDLVLDRHEKKEKVRMFTNIELCDISEDLVFTEPYYDYKNRNIISEGVEEFVKENLYENEKLKSEVGYLRNNFMNNAQALIHGDLHSGSIFINNNGIKVIDPEFAFYGPIGYDLGNVIGNLIFSLANKYITEKNNEEYIEWILKTISEIFDLFKEKAINKLDELVNLPLYNKEFKEKYVLSLLSDGLGYAGTEIIRRTVGDSKVVEVTSVNDLEKRQQLEKLLIKIGVNLIIKRYEIINGKEIIDEFWRLVN